MAKIFIIRIDDADFDEIREKYGKEPLHAVEDEQAMETFFVDNGIPRVQVWQIN